MKFPIMFYLSTKFNPKPESLVYEESGALWVNLQTTFALLRPFRLILGRFLLHEWLGGLSEFNVFILISKNSLEGDIQLATM